MSPAIYRASILHRGLCVDPVREYPLGPRPSWVPKNQEWRGRYIGGNNFAIDGQPTANYLAHSLNGVYTYIDHCRGRFSNHGKFKVVDIYEVIPPEDLHTDNDWITPASYTFSNIPVSDLTLLGSLGPDDTELNDAATELWRTIQLSDGGTSVIMPKPAFSGSAT